MTYNLKPSHVCNELKIQCYNNVIKKLRLELLGHLTYDIVEVRMYVYSAVRRHFFQYDYIG